MSRPNEGTVAPRERVNIVYRPATGNAAAEVELPLKLLVAGDFTGAPDARPLEQRDPVSIDKSNFNEVLKGQSVHVDLRVPDHLTGRPDTEIEAHLSFSTMGDFAPERVAEQVPELKALLDLREALASLKGPLSNVPEFRSKLQGIVKNEDARRQILGEMGLTNEGGPS